MAERPEVAEARLHAEYADLLVRFFDAKDNAANDPAAWQAVKLEMRAYRQEWRGIRRYQQELALAGDPAAVAKVLADIGEGGAIAAPAPHTSGVDVTEVVATKNTKG